ncbi:unnamed protein product [Enterobius vermicularis]|uniref:7TM_GPCR_Srx domain-containing protein n=1 Tax=Enterobius vermicularis TaxID=51028 RepID=A0A0N4UXE2_ENTVE|nr:unnamed protein product [Enterobius vermicularis]
MIDDDFEGVTFSHLIFKSRLYDALGTCVIILNCLILTVICTDNFLKRKMINGVAYLVSGVGREIAVRYDHYNRYIPVWKCMTTKPWPVLLLIGGISFFKYSILVWITLAYVSSYYSNSKTDSLCSVLESAGDEFGTLNFSSMALFYAVATILTFRVFQITKNSNAVNKSEIRRQKLLLTIDFISLLQVAIPSVLLILDLWRLIDLSFFQIASYILYGSSSLWKILIYVIFRPDFRNRLFRILHIRRIDHGTFKSEISRSKIINSSVLMTVQLD